MSDQGHDTTPAVVPSTTPVLELSHITKRFGALTANDDISLTLGAGEVLALLGENGAGKSTLMAILFGHYVADEGSIRVHGEVLPSGNPRAALAAGIGMVHQHFALADNLSVLDNVLLGTESLWSPVSHRATAREKLMGAQQVQTGVQAAYSAMQGGAQVAQMPMIAPIADEIMKSAGYQAPNPGGDDPNFLTPEGAALELQDGAFDLLAGVDITDDPTTARWPGRGWSCRCPAAPRG